jgi:hypothetical protein
MWHDRSEGVVQTSPVDSATSDTSFHWATPSLLTCKSAAKISKAFILSHLITIIDEVRNTVFAEREDIGEQGIGYTQKQLTCSGSMHQTGSTQDQQCGRQP